jgi:hypothetical protein
MLHVDALVEELVCMDFSREVGEHTTWKKYEVVESEYRCFLHTMLILLQGVLER